MKNQAYSELYRNYRSVVEDYKVTNDNIIRTKVEMARFWKYKNDYPADWKRMAEKLTDNRKKVALLKHVIRTLKGEMRTSNSNHPQN